MLGSARMRFEAANSPPAEPAPRDVRDLFYDVLSDPNAKKRLESIRQAEAAEKRAADEARAEQAKLAKDRDAFASERGQFDRECEQQRAQMEAERALVAADRKTAARAAAEAEADRKHAAELVAEQRKRLAAVERAMQGAA